MLSTELRILLIVMAVIYFAIVLFLLKKKSLILKYSLIWFLSSVVLLVFAIFPQIVGFFARLLGIASETNAIFLVVIFFILLLLISLSVIVSRQHKQIKTLIQEVSLLKKEIKDKENEENSK